jgi:hypothetical protein
MRVFNLIGIILLTACSADENQWVKPDSNTLGCEDYQTVLVDKGVLTNNVWNKQAANNKSYSQCLESRQINDELQYGWSWSWPDTQRAVFGQPQIKIGQSPWTPDSTFGENFPIAVDQLASLNVNSELEVSTSGDHNVALTMWFVDSVQNTKESIRLELMVWTYYTSNQFNPGGSKKVEFQHKGTIWEYWRDKEWADPSGVNEATWEHIAFRSKSPSLQASVDVKVLIDFAMEMGHIDPDWIISDLEFGTEVMTGQGLAWIKEFDVEFSKVSTTSSLSD